MEIIEIKKRKATHDDPGAIPGLFIRVSAKEAHKLIESLAAQLVRENPNSGRWEAYTSGKLQYFSIAVHEE